MWRRVAQSPYGPASTSFFPQSPPTPYSVNPGLQENTIYEYSESTPFSTTPLHVQMQYQDGHPSYATLDV